MVSGSVIPAADPAVPETATLVVGSSLGMDPLDMNENHTPHDTPSGDISEVAVIGGGAAGLSAALVLTRARRRVVVLDAGQPRNAPAAHMQGFLSRDGMPPAQLLAVGRDEVTGYGGLIVRDTVTSVHSADEADP